MSAADFQGWEIPGAATFNDGPGGLVQLCIHTPLANALIYLHGAHVAEFQPVGEEPVLFMSEAGQYAEGKPIRGGVPLIFPWFGPRAGRPDSPAHGFARTVEWEIESLASEDGRAVEVVLKLSASEETRALWPHEFNLRHRIQIGTDLKMTLEVENTSDETMEFEEAFHTYFAVGSVHEAKIEGLTGATYIDKLDGQIRKIQAEAAIDFMAETEHFYVNTSAACEVVDPVLQRRIHVGKSGSSTTVVWNPWIGKSLVMADIGNDEWPGFVCVETANAGENFVTLPVGEIHRMTATISIVK